MKRSIATASLALALFASVRPALAQYYVREAGDETPPKERFFALPYAFYLNSTGFAGGVAASSVGHGQPNLVLFATGYASVNGSYGLIFQSRNLQLLPFDRLFLDADVASLEFAESDNFVDGNPAFADERAGSSGSSQDNFVTAESLDLSGKLTFKYLLPIGNGKDDIIHQYIIEEGLLKSYPTGGDSLNPLTSGRSFIQVIPFLRSRDLDPIDGVGIDQDFNTAGLRLGYRWDNTDFTVNPSKGNRFEFVFSRDFGGLDSSGTYSTVTANWQQFVGLGTSDLFRQQVLAFDLWTAHSPTFNYNRDGSTTGAPPYYEGATLGGFNRLRGYPGNRFHDRSAVSGTAELRLSPVWNPLGDIGAFRILEVELVQIVFFGEVGEVASNYKLDDLFADMKWDVGTGLRVFARRTLVRADFAISPESWQFRAFIGQAF